MAEHFRRMEPRLPHLEAQKRLREEPQPQTSHIWGQAYLGYREQNIGVMAQKEYRNIVTKLAQGGVAYEMAEAIIGNKVAISEVRKRGWFSGKGGLLKMIDALELQLQHEPDPDLLALALREHGNVMMRRERELLEKIAPVVSGIDAGFRRFATVQDVNIANIGNLDDISYHILDTLQFAPEEKKFGKSELAPPTIYVARNLSHDELSVTLAHETGHILAGATIRGSGDKNSMFLVERAGVQMEGRFAWLNEAITERIAYLVLGKDKRDTAYATELAILDHLMTKGKRPVSFQKFLQAYFEVTPESGNTMTAWRALSEELRAAWGDGFIVRLDARIQMEGINRALEILTNTPNTI